MPPKPYDPADPPRVFTRLLNQHQSSEGIVQRFRRFVPQLLPGNMVQWTVYEGIELHPKSRQSKPIPPITGPAYRLLADMLGWTNEEPIQQGPPQRVHDATLAEQLRPLLAKGARRDGSVRGDMLRAERIDNAKAARKKRERAELPARIATVEQSMAQSTATLTQLAQLLGVQP